MQSISRYVVVLGTTLCLLGCQSSSIESSSKGAGSNAGVSGGGGLQYSAPSTSSGTSSASGAGGMTSTSPSQAALSPSAGMGGSYAMGGAMSTSTTGSAGSMSVTLGTGGATSTGGNTTPSSGDKYLPVGTNPFVMTAHDPFSTFAADVDTASYDLFRRDAGQGLLPAAASVRLEEYVNYFSYDYPAPAADAAYPFQVSLAAAKQVFARGTSLLRVGVQAALPPPFVKKATNIVFLLDVSGSMGDSN